MKIDSVYDWMGSKSPDITELSESQLLDLMKSHDVMLWERDGKVILLLDRKGKKFRTR